MNILFVCSSNLHRSKTAESYFGSLHAYKNYNFKSAGTNLKFCLKNGTTVLTDELLDWSDKIYVMEEHHYNIIKDNCENLSNLIKIEILNIDDIYNYMDNDLIEILKSNINFT